MLLPPSISYWLLDTQVDDHAHSVLEHLLHRHSMPPVDLSTAPRPCPAPEEVRAFLAEALTSAHLEVLVAGNIDAPAARAVASRAAEEVAAAAAAGECGAAAAPAAPAAQALRRRRCVRVPTGRPCVCRVTADASVSACLAYFQVGRCQPEQAHQQKGAGVPALHNA
jgi:hypothetical protein